MQLVLQSVNCNEVGEKICSIFLNRLHNPIEKNTLVLDP